MNNGLLITVAVVTIWPTGVCAQQPPQVTTSGQEQIDYPVDHLPMPCSPGACGGIQLVDLDLVARTSDEASSGRIRFRLGNRAFLFGVLDTDADRNVPQLAAEASENHDSVSGSTTRVYAALLGIPWPPAWPWIHNERAVKFLELEFRYGKTRSVGGLQEVGRVYALTSHLNGETRVWALWRDPLSTPLQLATARNPGSRLEIGFRYLLGL